MHLGSSGALQGAYPFWWGVRCESGLCPPLRACEYVSVPVTTRAREHTKERAVDQVETRGPLLYTVSAASKRLGISRTTCTALLDRGELGYVRLLGHDRRVPESELVRYVERNVVRAAGER